MPFEPRFSFIDTPGKKCHLTGLPEKVDQLYSLNAALFSNNLHAFKNETANYKNIFQTVYKTDKTYDNCKYLFQTPALPA